MWRWFVAACVTLSLDPAHSNSGLSSTSFSNELRTGFARLFQNGVEQPLQTQPFILLNPTDFQTSSPQLHRPAPFSPLASTGYQTPRPRYHPPRGGHRPNDVLVMVVKTNSNCTNAVNGTQADGDGDDDDEGPNPDDDVEEVTVVTGGAEKGKEPSRCVWAILSCCAPANTPIRYSCFDVLGCSAAFWDTNPCVPAILKTALDQATLYYGPATATNRTEMPTPAAPAASNTATMSLMDALTAGVSTATAATTVAEDTAAKSAAPGTTESASTTAA